MAGGMMSWLPDLGGSLLVVVRAILVDRGVQVALAEEARVQHLR